MKKLHLPTGVLEYELVDLTAPWMRPARTVVFLHGVGTDLGIWSEWLPILSRHYRVLRFSLRGFGGSRHYAPASLLSLDLLAQDLFSLVDETGIDEFSVVAESFGGCVALQAALLQPKRIERLCLMSTPHRGADIKPIQAWTEMTESALGMARWHEEMMSSRFAQGCLATDALNWFATTQQQTDASWLRQMSQLIMATDFTGQLDKVDAPVLLMTGDSSPYVGLRQVAKLHELLANSNVCIFPGARHGIAFSHAQTCAERFLAFAAGYRGAKPQKETV